MPMKIARAEPRSAPSDIAVPSSRNWKPTIPLRTNIQAVAAMEAMWTAVKPYLSMSQKINLCAYSSYQSNVAVKWEAADSEDLADLSDNKGQQEHLDLSIIQLASRASGNRILSSQPYLLPTAACFLSDRHRRYPETIMAMPQKIIEPSPNQYPNQRWRIGHPYRYFQDAGCCSAVFRPMHIHQSPLRLSPAIG